MGIEQTLIPKSLEKQYQESSVYLSLSLTRNGYR